MDPKLFKKEHPDLFKLWVRHKFKFGDNPIPQKNKNYIISIVSELKRCFVLIEYNDGWYSEGENGRTEDISIPSLEVISYSEKKDISENNFISFLTDIIKIYSAENQLIICNRTNGPGRVVFDAIKKEVFNMLNLENARMFPISRRSKYGKEIFKNIGQGWDMSLTDEKQCLDAMRTAMDQGYFTLAADKSKQMFDVLSSKEQLNVEPFLYCWAMLSFIRLSAMNLFMET